ncbi:glycosyltransferase family 9 protein [Halomonas organivorans]|uniref:ADP-heptose:LPS heptosyltransferase n=1 Tax=Halomonas organivorans TaxID=257772 RepID=A0A7W5G416_9GAMM|nr:glycosyltransferase family 9 protein [Halomonas organivorans]MBB3139460.1 ADP-heptose:LPS heptosyltransferase [Halomonas organivorans]
MAVPPTFSQQLLRHPIRTLSRRYHQFRYDYSSGVDVPETLHAAVLYVPKKIGDGMAVFPVIRALQARGVPRIVIVASAYNEVVFRRIDDERVEVVTIDQHRDIGATRAVARDLKARHGRIDLCIEGTIRYSSAACCFVGTLQARCNLRLGGSPLRCYSPLGEAARSLHDRGGARPHCWAALMREAGIAEVPGAYEFPIAAEDEQRVRRSVAPLGPYVALNLEGGHPARQLSLDQGRRLCELLHHEHGLPVVMVFGPDGEGKAQRLATDLPWVHLLALDVSLPHSVAIVKHAALVVTPDTAVLHMASAWNRPTLGLFARPQRRWRPLAEHGAMIETGSHLADLDMDEVARALAALPLGDDARSEHADRVRP